jgi:hypothetical protein
MNIPGFAAELSLQPAHRGYQAPRYIDFFPTDKTVRAQACPGIVRGEGSDIDPDMDAARQVALTSASANARAQCPSECVFDPERFEVERFPCEYGVFPVPGVDGKLYSLVGSFTP